MHFTHLTFDHSTIKRKIQFLNGFCNMHFTPRFFYQFDIRLRFSVVLVKKSYIL